MDTGASRVSTQLSGNASCKSETKLAAGNLAVPGRRDLDGQVFAQLWRIGVLWVLTGKCADIPPPLALRDVRGRGPWTGARMGYCRISGSFTGALESLRSPSSEHVGLSPRNGSRWLPGSHKTGLSQVQWQREHTSPNGACESRGAVLLTSSSCHGHFLNYSRLARPPDATRS